MKKNILISGLFIILLTSCNNIPEGTGFDEPKDPNPISFELWEKAESGLQVAFGSTDRRYEYHYPPETVGKNDWSGSAWRGETLNIQLKLWSREPVQRIRVSAAPLRSQSGDEITKENINIFPVRYVLTDEFLTGCGWRDSDTIPAYIAADMLDYNRIFNIDENTLRPVWLTIEIPEDSEPGIYEGHVKISYRGGKQIELPINLKVYDLVLPPPSEWVFHLDLWQNPFAVARFYDVEPWSIEHWEILPPYLEMLAKAGQKCITASILHRPWGGQTFDHFESMIEWKHLGDGVWEYDYSIFDRWVEMAMDAGITEQINCYSMVPWGNQVRYFDADSTDFVTVTLQPGSDEYAKIWSPFLTNFRDHLKGRGWIDKTMIAMDERGIDEMRNMVALIGEVAPEFQIAYAGNYLDELSHALDDLCVHIIPELEKDIISARTQKGLITTFYTMCARPEHPNNFTFSPPAEQAWLGWYAAARGYTGFLRWAYNSWVEDPLMDSRFRTWPAGDTYQIYPGPRSSIRFERLREGIQDYEKIRILRQFAAETGQEQRLKELDKVLEKFTVQEVQETPADYWLNKGKTELDILSAWAENRNIVRFGICTDTHKDIMHDADERLTAFIDEASEKDLDFIIQLGDFVRPYDYNLEFLSIWNSYHGKSYHVIGNHEPDGGFTKQDVVNYLGMPHMYYSFEKNGFRFIVLDGNDWNPSPERPPGYSRYIGDEQIEWLKNELKSTEKRIVVFSHQSLESENGIENRKQIREIFEEENRSAGFNKIIACFSGHHHTDYAVNINGIHYIQINSMSYYWAGGDYQVIRYSEEIDEEYPWIKYTIPYKDPLYAFVEINNDAIIIEGKETSFVGPGPEELGMPDQPENNPIVPKISSRELQLQ